MKMVKRKLQQMDCTQIYNLKFISYKYCMGNFPMNDGTGPVKQFCCRFLKQHKKHQGN